jgi:YVTN family beta-propeller protein
VQVTPDGSLAVVTSYDSAITFIDTTTNTITGVIKTDSSIHPAGLAISPDGTRAYVTNLFDTGSSVLVIDIASRTIVNTISVPIFPYSLAITPDGALVYVTFYQSGTVYVIDTLSNTVAGAFTVPAPAYGIAFSPTGLRAYVATAGAPGQLQVVDTATYRVVAAVTLGNHPNDVKVTPDGAFVFVTNFQSNFVSQVATRTNTLVRNIPVGNPNWGLVLFR